MLQLIPTPAASFQDECRPPRRTSLASGSQLSAIRTKSLRASSCEAYDKDVRLFVKSGGVVPCDALALRKYIWSMRSKLAPATLYRRCIAVRYAHQLIGQRSPTDDATLRPLLRALQRGFIPDKNILQVGAPAADDPGAKTRKPRVSLPITRRLLAQILAPLPCSAIDRRDRALLLLGFAGAVKRGALVAINVGDLRFTADALIVRIHLGGLENGTTMSASGCGDAAPSGRQIAIPVTGGDLCVVKAVKDYIEREALDIEPPDSPLFRAGDRGSNLTRNRLDSAVVGLICKKFVAAAGIDAKPYSAQSLVTGRRSEFAKGVL